MENPKLKPENKNNEQENSDYFLYFKEKVKEVDNIGKPLFRKIIYFIILDTLSKCAYPKINKNKERFVKFIDNFSNWQDRNRISAYQLYLYLKVQVEFLTQLKVQVEPFIKKWKDGEVIRPRKEPFIDELTFEKEWHKKKIEEFTYKALLWKYRCFLVHELREPGYPMEVSNDDSTPYYIGMESMKGDNNSERNWELTFPLDFIRNLLLNCLENLEEHCKKKGINPYKSYKFSSFWFE